jgi:hypothetical protein
MKVGGSWAGATTSATGGGAAGAGIVAGAIYEECVDEGVVGTCGWYGVVTTAGG